MSAPSRAGAALAAAGMTCVGSSVAVSQTIVDAPLFTLQAIRYALAAALLLGLARATGRSLSRPRGTEWCWLAGVAAVGLVLFNVAVVRGVEHAEPAVIGVAVAAVPVLLAFGGGRPTRTLIGGAVLVTAGAALVQGGGRTDATGLGWALLVLLCEVGFTLLAVPVLGRLGPWAVSLHAVWIAAAGLIVLGLLVEGPGAAGGLAPGDLLAAAHLGVVVTALAFVLWYSAVGRLGAGRAGLFTGLVPVVAAAGGVVLGGPPPSATVWLGTAVVMLGLVLGFGRSGRGEAGGTRRAGRRRRSRPAVAPVGARSGA